MNDDTPDIVPGQVALTDGYGNPISPASKNGKRVRPPGDHMKSYVTREEMLEALPKAALAIGQKMFDQITEETSANLEEMEKVIFARVMLEIERRSLRGRARALWFRWFPQAPQLVANAEAVEALDPNAVKP